MGSQVGGKDRSRLLRRGTFGEVRGEGRRARERTKERIHRFRREERVTYHVSALAVAITDKACWETEM